MELSKSRLLNEWRTCGDFQNETDAEKTFDWLVNQEHWQVFKQVNGKCLVTNQHTEASGKVRIDRILLPTQKLFDSGWENGPVGIEIKRSDEKIGRPLGQIADYLNCVFELQTVRGPIFIQLKNVFLFPMSSPGGPLESLCSSLRIGFVSHINCRGEIDGLKFYLGGGMVYSSHEGGRLQERQRTGQKFGSR